MSGSASRNGSDGGAPYDVVGVGFGPSNLAIAAAVAEHRGPALSARFLERQPRFGWHRGMLIDGATMRVSYLKDLVTMRNPASGYSFLSYLHEHGRLADFINFGSAHPFRVEFHDYLDWVAARFAHQVDYGTEVRAVRGVRNDAGVIDLLEVDADVRGEQRTFRTRNVAVSTGLQPRLPEGVVAGERIWHSSQLVTRTEPGSGSVVLTGPEPKRVAVIGAGQSAAEALDHLHRLFPDAEVCALFGRYGYSPADDSPFANRIFDPGAVDEFHGASEQVRARLLGYHGNTNYAVVDPGLIEDLYRRHYQERVLGRERLRFLNASVVHRVVEGDGRVEVEVESLLESTRQVLSCDLVVCATGYRSGDPADLIGELAQLCVRDGSGRLDVRRDYRLVTAPELTAGIYVQGATEHTHGISSTLLSTVAVRSGEITDSLAARRAAAPAPGDGAPRLAVPAGAR